MAKLVQFVRLEAPGLVEELYHVRRRGTDYLIDLQRTSSLSYSIVASGTPTEVSEAFAKRQEDVQRGVAGYGELDVVTTKPDQRARDSMTLFEDPQWGLTWKDVPVQSDRDVFDALLAKQFQDWKGSFRYLALTKHRYWPTFQVMVHEAVRKEYGNRIRLYRGVHGEQASKVKHGEDLLLREFSSWTADEPQAREIARFGSAYGHRHRQWLVVSHVFSVNDVVFAPVVLPDYAPNPRILMGLQAEEEFVVSWPSKRIPHDKLRLGRSGRATNPAPATDLIRRLKF